MPIASSTHDALCSIRAFRPFADLLDDRGVSLMGELELQGLTDNDLSDPDLRVTHRKVAGLVKRAVERSGEPALGVLAAERVQQGDFGVVEYAAASCATQGESIRCAARYLGLMHDGMDAELEEHGDRCALVLRMAEGLEAVPAAIEFTLATWLIYARRWTERALSPIEVTFQHSGPEDTAEYERVFRCPVRFDAEVNALWMDRRAVELPYRMADARLKQILQQHAEKQLESMPKRQRFSQRVLALVDEELTDGNPGVEHIASRLHMSPRTLHRRLKEEGTTHKQLVDELRRSRAMRLLCEEEQPIGEVSYRLGFSHVNAFHKAFKRWTGQTPATYREQYRERARAMY